LHQSFRQSLPIACGIKIHPGTQEGSLGAEGSLSQE
jgi:hypothetical protein